MSNRIPTPPFTESLVSKTTQDTAVSPNNQAQGLSEAAVNELIQKEVQLLWKAFGDAQATSAKERAEMKLKIDELESSEKYLKNQNHTLFLNNEQLVDKVEKVETENARLTKMLLRIDLSGRFQHLTTEQDPEREKSSLKSMKEKIQERVADRKEVEKITMNDDFEMPLNKFMKILKKNRTDAS